MTTHQLYGVRASDAAATARFLGELLGCTFQERESDYLGIYWLARFSDTQVKVVTQPDPEGESLEEEFPEFGTLIYVDGEPIATELNGAEFPLGTLEALRHNGN